LVFELVAKVLSYLAEHNVRDIASGFAHKVAGLRKSDPLVDWSGIDEHGGQKRRIIKWVSERTPGRHIPSAARSVAFGYAHEAT
jgi:hypothetical protein